MTWKRRGRIGSTFKLFATDRRDHHIVRGHKVRAYLWGLIASFQGADMYGEE